MIQGHSSSSVKKLTFFRSFEREREFSAQKINKDDRVIHKMEQKKFSSIQERKYFLVQIENCFDVFYVCTKKKQMRLVVHTFLFVLSYSVFKKSKCAEKELRMLNIRKKTDF